MKIILGADHAGFQTKEKLKKWFDKQKIEYEDLGAKKLDKKDDYPDYAKKVSKRVAKDKDSKGILICGSGFGMAIAANKVKGIRAVPAYDHYTAIMSRKDNNTNVLCLRGRRFSFKKNQKIVSAWLKTSFLGGRHLRRVKKISSMGK